MPAQFEDVDCIRPEASDDIDVRANSGTIADPELCLTNLILSENGADWRMSIIRNTGLPGPLWFVPHDEEDVAFTAAVYAVERYGGVVVAVENNGRRLVDGRDPNRIFATTPFAVDACDGARAPTPLYTSAILQEWDRSFPIIGLHNNWDGFVEGGGAGTISVLRQDDKMIPFASPDAVGRFADEDTIVMLVSTRPPADDDDGRRTIDWFNTLGVHVIYRYVTPGNNGCTIADYLTLNQLGPYFNLEVEHGDQATQPLLIDRLMEFLDSTSYQPIP